MGGDLNDIQESSEKSGGRQRSDRSFQDFLRIMKMVDVSYIRRDYTWANSREGDDFVEERLDRFLVSTELHYHFPNAVVRYIRKQASDHCMLIMDIQPTRQHTTPRLFFDKRYLEVPGFKDEVARAWNSPQQGTLMFQDCSRIKNYRIALLKFKSK